MTNEQTLKTLIGIKASLTELNNTVDRLITAAEDSPVPKELVPTQGEIIWVRSDTRWLPRVFCKMAGNGRYANCYFNGKISGKTYTWKYWERYNSILGPKVKEQA